MERFGTALVPDFQEFYGLRLVQVVQEWDPEEVCLLISGLPQDSRLAARLDGYEGGKGWSDKDYLQLDIRNALEAVRFMKASEGKKTPEFRQWEHHPGYGAEKRRQRRSRRDRLRALAGTSGRAELE